MKGPRFNPRRAVSSISSTKAAAVMGILSVRIKEFVNQQKLGFIATVCPDGTPNLSPKGTLIAVDDSHLAFLDICSPGTSDNLAQNPWIEINVVDFFLRKGYRFKGKAEVISGGDVFNSVLSIYGDAAKKYTVKNVVRVRVERVLEITSPVYDTGAVESEVEKRWVDYWSNIHHP
jgi:predicted pyridoxine 5'-phosphate oxidase superfamily flavin-nucleotide-binding protein